MQYTGKYKSPLGNILLAADEKGLTGLWFEGQKYFARCLDKEHEEKNLPVFRDAKRWLDTYFTGKEPNFKLPLHFTGTSFQNEVWEILYTIPYGKTTTYGEIAGFSPKRKDLRKCRLRPSAAPSDITKYQLSFPATESSALPAALPDTPAELTER